MLLPELWTWVDAHFYTTTRTQPYEMRILAEILNSRSTHMHRPCSQKTLPLSLHGSLNKYNDRVEILSS